MCKSQADGGQRCAAHTRPKFENTPASDPAWDAAAAEYASTPEGRERLTHDAQRANDAHDFEAEARLLTALAKGASIRAANAEAAATIKEAAASGKGNDLASWGPAVVDTELVRLFGEQQTAEAQYASLMESLSAGIARWGLQRRGEWGQRPTCTPEEVRAWLNIADSTAPEERTGHQRQYLQQWERAQQAKQAAVEAAEKMEPYEAEFERRGGWSRAFLVTNQGGHVHRDRNCSTCRPTTQYYWVTDMSGKSEAEIVDAAGDRCCSVCYPSAPVETYNRPTRIFSPEEQDAARARGERAAAAVQRNADKVAKSLTADGSELEVRYGDGRYDRERFKTERAATTWLVDSLYGYRSWRMTPMPEQLKTAHEQVIDAIASKHGKSRAEVLADLEKKIRAKAKREHRELRD